MMFNLSLNEIDACTKKAARGAGMSWGLAEEAGKAVRWLARYNLPNIELIVPLLEQIAGKKAKDRDKNVGLRSGKPLKQVIVFWIKHQRPANVIISAGSVSAVHGNLSIHWHSFYAIPGTPLFSEYLALNWFSLRLQKDFIKIK